MGVTAAAYHGHSMQHKGSVQEPEQEAGPERTLLGGRLFMKAPSCAGICRMGSGLPSASKTGSVATAGSVAAAAPGNGPGAGSVGGLGRGFFAGARVSSYQATYLSLLALFPYSFTVKELQTDVQLYMQGGAGGRKDRCGGGHGSWGHAHLEGSSGGGGQRV